MVLGGEDVLNGIGDKRGHFFFACGPNTYAGRPGHLSTKCGQSFNEDGGLDGPIEILRSMLLLLPYSSRHTCGGIQQYGHLSRAEQQRAIMKKKKVISGLTMRSFNEYIPSS